MFVWLVFGANIEADSKIEMKGTNTLIIPFELIDMYYVTHKSSFIHGNNDARLSRMKVSDASHVILTGQQVISRQLMVWHAENV